MELHGNRGTYIEGVGDEVLLSVTTVFSILAAVIMFATQRLRQRQNVQEIHPDSHEGVMDARQRLREQNRRAWTGDNATQTQNTTNRSERTVCPICINDVSYAIETNCGHIFCGQCMLTYWRHGTWLGAVRCPVCRQQVTILLFSFSAEESQSASEEKEEIVRDINNYNRRFSGEPRPIMDYIRDLPTLLRHAVSEFFSIGGLMWMFRLRILVVFIAALLYFISPFDIIPEAVFGFLGFMDDLFIGLLLLIYVSIIYRNFVESRARQAEIANGNPVQ